jgi:hypothetical protein
MCRNIKTLYNFDPPVTDAEIHMALTTDGYGDAGPLPA